MFHLYHKGKFRNLWASIMLIGFIAVLLAQAFVMPNRPGENVVIGTKLLTKFFSKGSVQNHPVAFQNKTHPLHLRINKHFQSEKLIFVLPNTSEICWKHITLPKPLYYYNNHFVSSFLYVCSGRAPPFVA
ncbi:MAG: hypothetical protein PW786_14560 [Arachidicoccus sp.]|nr:hypothetical protein [Arachidicoccus sp.]